MTENEFIKMLIDNHGGFNRKAIKLDQFNEGKSLTIAITTDYDYVDFDFAFLCLISETLGTKNINIGDRWSDDGCETCNHGSTYYIELHIKDITKPLND